MSTVTIFTAPKPFLDPHIKIIQQNAIRSWKELGDEIEVFLIGDEPGIKQAASDLNVRHIPGVEVNQQGTPLVSSIFSLARQASSGELLLYLNADILLLPDTLVVIREVCQLNQEFLLVGRRWDLDITREIDFSSEWASEIRARIKDQGKLRTYTAIDYFIFPRQQYQEILPFAIGRAGWDNWMIFHGMKQNLPVIDLTPSLMVVHQNHDYRHLPDGVVHYDLAESQQNVELGGGMRNLYDLLDVSLVYQGGRIRPKAPSLERFLRRLERIVIPDQQVGWRWSLTRILRKTRRRIFSTR
jgi:hypothetical protein